MSGDTPHHQDLRAALAARAAERVIISGCSGGGKSSLIAELGRRGHAAYEEPGRQVVREQQLIAGRALPWDDLGLFVELTVSRSLYFAIDSLRKPGASFFDRGPIDQVSALEASGISVPQHLDNAIDGVGFHRRVFLVPPWPEIYRTDAERRHGFDEAASAYRHLAAAYARRGYETILLPRESVAARADFVLARI